MKNMKLLLSSMLLGVSGLLVAAGGILKVTNKSTYNIKPYVGSRNTQEDDAYVSYPGMSGKSRDSFGDARSDNKAFVAPNTSVDLAYGHSPRAILVDFFDANSKVFKTIAFPFGETNSEIYVLGGKDNVIGDVAVSVAYWNKDALKALEALKDPKDSAKLLFPTGFIGDKDGNLTPDQEAVITPKSDDIAKVWNYNSTNHSDLMVCLYDMDLSPKVKK